MVFEDENEEMHICLRAPPRSCDMRTTFHNQGHSVHVACSSYVRAGPKDLSRQNQTCTVKRYRWIAKVIGSPTENERN